MIDGACFVREDMVEYRPPPPSEEPDWQQTHRELTRLAKRQSEHDYEQAKWIAIAHRTRADAKLGYGSIREYLTSLFGWGGRWLQEKIRVALALIRAIQVDREEQR